MDVYLVGGAVRDELLGRPVSERDWVVVGATAAEMLAAGYRQVGRDFPVFLHPETGDEYALARTERKTGPGHQGFEVHADPSVTLEEDLVRRDLTINAMARSDEGQLIDPFGGQADLRAGVLRHVSEAFAEDPLRVFRVARFAAALPSFSLADETCSLMARMATDGVLAELSAERVWAELVKAIAAPAPARFVEVLRDVDALEPWLPEFETADPGIPAGSMSSEQAFATYVSALDPDAIAVLAGRLKAPKACARLAGWVARQRPLWSDWRQAEAGDLVRALEEVHAFRPDSHLVEALTVCAALGGTDLDALLRAASDIRASVQVAPLRAAGLEGAALGRALSDARRIKLQEAQQARATPDSE
jgi:tRNA nucleotidyltransferase (CCA-adding enzyme)